MADCFLVLPPLTRDNLVILGKNSQRPTTEVQEVIYRQPESFPNDSKLQCTYIEVDQVGKTHGVILSKPAWMWGSEMGANDQGMSVAMAPVWTKLNGPSDLEERLLGQDLTRLALERAGSAREAVGVITGLLSQYGQGGPGSEEMGSQKWAHHNSFLIADKSEGWILESVGKYWAAKNIKDGFYNISTTLTLGSDFDLSSEGLIEKAKGEGLYDPDSGPFDFAAVFSDPQKTQGEDSDTPDRREKGRQLLEKLTTKKEFRMVEMMEILRDEDSNICMSGPFMTTGSMISVLSPEYPACYWLTATPNPAASFYKPFIFCPNNTTGVLTKSPDYGEKDPVRVQPRFQEQVNREHPLYKGHKKFLNLLERDELQGHMIKNNLRELERNCLEDTQEILSQFTEQSCAKVGGIFGHMCDIEMNFYKI